MTTATETNAATEQETKEAERAASSVADPQTAAARRVRPLARVPLRLRLRWWWQRRRMSPEVRELVDAAARDFDMTVLYGADRAMWPS